MEMREKMISPKYSEDYHSLDQQIKEARKRAEEFSQNIQKTRNTENETMRNAEEERRKWAASYEEKTVMIEQLQRELASTVEALNHERKHEKSSRSVSVTGIENSVSSNQRFLNSKHIPIGSSRYSSHVPILPPPPPFSSAAAAPPEGERDGVGNDVKSGHSSSSSHHHPSHLNISQTMENNLRREITNLKIELEQTKSAWKDSETKINFYLSQIQHLETELSTQTQEKNQSQDRLKSFEKINLKFETEINLLKSFEEEMKKSHEETVAELHQTIETLLSERTRAEKTILTQNEEIQHLRQQIGKNETDRKEWEAHLKELHHKELELLQKQLQLEVREKYSTRPQDTPVPVAVTSSTKSPLPPPSVSPARSRNEGTRPQNRTKVRYPQIDSSLHRLTSLSSCWLLVG
jgi:chromosome segregation ATPase